MVTTLMDTNCVLNIQEDEVLGVLIDQDIHHFVGVHILEDAVAHLLEEAVTEFV